MSAWVALLVALAAALLPAFAAAGLAWARGASFAALLPDPFVRVSLASACVFVPIGLAFTPLAVRRRVGNSVVFAAFCAASSAPGVFAFFGVWVLIALPDPLPILLGLLLFYLPAPLAAMTFAKLRYRPAPKTVDGV